MLTACGTDPTGASLTASNSTTKHATAKAITAIGHAPTSDGQPQATRTAAPTCRRGPRGDHQPPGSRHRQRTPASCTSAAVVRAVAKGGVINFNCGPKPVTITMTATAKVVNTSHQVVLDGGGMVTLSGGGKRQILYMDTCDKKQIWTTDHCNDQEWPQLVVQNMTFEDGYSAVQQTKGTPYGGGGGGAIYAEGGQLKVVNSRFIDNRCYQVGPDLGGAAIRAICPVGSQPRLHHQRHLPRRPVLQRRRAEQHRASWDVLNSLMTDNKAIGWGEPGPARHARRRQRRRHLQRRRQLHVVIEGTVIRDNTAREGGGAIFFVVDNNTGTLTIKDSTLHDNPSGEFFTAGYPGIFFLSSGHPIVIDSTIN